MAFPSLALSGPVGFVALVALFFAVAIDYSSALLPMAAKLAPKLINTIASPALAPSPPVLAPAPGPGPSSNGCKEGCESAGTVINPPYWRLGLPKGWETPNENRISNLYTIMKEYD